MLAPGFMNSVYKSNKLNTSTQQVNITFLCVLIGQKVNTPTSSLFSQFMRVTEQNARAFR